MIYSLHRIEIDEVHPEAMFSPRYKPNNIVKTVLGKIRDVIHQQNWPGAHLNIYAILYPFSRIP